MVGHGIDNEKYYSINEVIDVENMTFYRPTKVIINLEAIRENVRSLKSYLGNETLIIAVVKADGYGHGGVESARAALEAGATMVSVATPDEAVELREHGIGGDILVMATSPIEFAKVAATLRITVSVPGIEWLEALRYEQFEHPLKIHLKIDCGMGRSGLREVSELHSILKLLDESGQFILDGVFIHFSRADESDQSNTHEQYEAFMDFVKLLPERPRLVHASNSAATFLYPEYALNAVRFGIGLYGVPPSDYVGDRLPFQLQRALVMESELVQVKKLKKDSPISYGATYKTAGEEWIGTMPIGYADGLRRGLRGQEVLIAGERMPIVGTICMDQCMVRLSRKMPVGEKVILIGKQGDEEIEMEEWAVRLDTIPYEIAVSITKRVPRIYGE